MDTSGRPLCCRTGYSETFPVSHWIMDDISDLIHSFKNMNAVQHRPFTEFFNFLLIFNDLVQKLNVLCLQLFYTLFSVATKQR